MIAKAEIKITGNSDGLKEAMEWAVETGYEAKVVGLDEILVTIFEDSEDRLESLIAPFYAFCIEVAGISTFSPDVWVQSCTDFYF